MDLREAAATALSVGAPWTAHPPVDVPHPRRQPTGERSPRSAEFTAMTADRPRHTKRIRCDNSTCTASGNDQYYERNDHHEANGSGRTLLR